MGGFTLARQTFQMPQNQESLMEMLQNVERFKGLRLGQQLQQGQIQGQTLQNQQAQQDMQEYQAYKQALAQSNGDPRAALPQIMKVAPNRGLQLKKQLDEWDKADVEKKLKLLDIHEKQVQGLGQLAGSVKDQPSYEAAIGQAARAGLIEPQAAHEMLQQPFDPNKVAQWQQQAVTVQQQIQNQREQLQANETERHNREMEKHAGGDSVRYVSDWLASHRLPNTPENRQKAFAAFTKETKTDPRVAGLTVLLQRPTEVGDPNNPGQTVMVPGNQSYGMPGKSSSSVTVPKAVQTYMTSGKGGDQITAYNVAIAHLDTLKQMGAALNNGKLQTFNQLAQRWAQETGQEAPANFEAAKAALSGEVSATLKASGATDQEIAQVAATFSKAQAPEQLAGVANTYQTLLSSKRVNLEKRYNQGMQGKPAFGGSGHVIRLNGKRYQYNGNGDTADLSNYTELK